MKSIRELTMGSQQPEQIPKNKPLFEDPSELGWERDYGHEYEDSYNSSNYYNKTYKQQKENDIKISMIINNSEIGEIANESNKKYDWQLADLKAQEIAYDRVETLLGKNFESKYILTFNTIAGYDEYEVEILLTPTK